MILTYLYAVSAYCGL